MTKPKYLTAEKLGILPAERKALIAFVEAPALGRIVAVNGKAHYYDQSEVQDTWVAERNECGTAGCVAGFVFAHARHVQKLRTLRGGRSAQAYINASFADDKDFNPKTPLLNDLYEDGDSTRSLAEARAVVKRALTTGKVRWHG